MSKKTNTVLIVTYLCVLVFLGPPYTQKAVTGGAVYSEVAQESNFSQKFWAIRKPLLNVASIAICIGIAEILCGQYLVRHLSSTKRVKQFAILTKLAVLMVSFAGVCFAIVAAVNLAIFYTGASVLLREFARADFVRYTGVTFISISSLIDQIKRHNYLKQKRIGSVIGDYYLRLYGKYGVTGDMKKANEAIANACEVDPFGVIPWITRAMFIGTSPGNEEEAEEYLKQAENNMKKRMDVTDEEKACYEYCVGTLLAGKGDMANAYTYVKKSLDMHYVPERAKFLKILEQQLPLRDKPVL